MADIIIKIGERDERGTVTLYPPGQEVIKAILLRWIRQGERGEHAAREMLRASMRDIRPGQLDYFRNAISFLAQRFACQVGERFNLRTELELISRLDESAPFPAHWGEYLIHSDLNGDTDELASAVDTGSGDVRERDVERPSRKGRGRKGQTHRAGNR